jgi:hypothetical protein
MNVMVGSGNPDAVTEKRLGIFPAGQDRRISCDVRVLQKIVQRLFAEAFLEVERFPDVTEQAFLFGGHHPVLRDEQEKPSEAFTFLTQGKFHCRSLTSYKSVLRSSQFSTEPVCRWRFSSSNATSSQNSGKDASGYPTFQTTHLSKAVPEVEAEEGKEVAERKTNTETWRTQRTTQRRKKIIMEKASITKSTKAKANAP